MSQDEPDLKFIARLLQETNQRLGVLDEVKQKLGTLEEVKVEVLQVKQRLAMISGWMEGQEEVSLAQSRRLTEMSATLSRVDQMVGEFKGMAESAYELGIALGQKLDGVAELSKSTYDMAADLKAAMGGEDASRQPKQQAAPGA